MVPNHSSKQLNGNRMFKVSYASTIQANYSIWCRHSMSMKKEKSLYQIVSSKVKSTMKKNNCMYLNNKLNLLMHFKNNQKKNNHNKHNKIMDQINKNQSPFLMNQRLILDHSFLRARMMKYVVVLILLISRSESNRKMIPSINT